MGIFIEVLVIGLVATLAMTAVLSLLHSPNFSMIDVVKVLGSRFTADQNKTFRTGVIAHTSVGIASAFVYIAIWSLFNFSGFVEYLFMGVLMGMAHGLVISILVLFMASEHNPPARFRKAGVGVAVAYLVAHIVYGLMVGIGAGAFDSKFKTLETIAQNAPPANRN